MTNITQNQALSEGHIAEQYRIRGRMLGVLIRDARKSVRRSVEVCARVLDISVDEFTAWEEGSVIPSLPQLELLAYYLDIPVQHFWSPTTREQADSGDISTQSDFIAVRQRMIGANLCRVRELAGFSLQHLGEVCEVSPQRIRSYEMGIVPIPVSHLVAFAEALDCNMDVFLEQASYVGKTVDNRHLREQLSKIDADLVEFMLDPDNQPYLAFAAELRQYSPDQLAYVAEQFLAKG